MADSRSVLIFRIGQLGDTVVSLPALWALRKHYAGRRLVLLCDHWPKGGLVGADQVLAGSGVVDDYLRYRPMATYATRLGRAWAAWRLRAAIRALGVDEVAYLTPSLRTLEQRARDQRFFAWCKARVIGMQGFDDPAVTRPGPDGLVRHEADNLLARLAVDGVAVPPPGHGRRDLNINATDSAAIDAWRDKLPPDGGRPWIGICAGSRMKAKNWMIDRYQQVVATLIQRHGVWPVMMGGPAESAVSDQLLAAWGCGYNACGKLGPRLDAALLSRCRLYLGNDTGTMHLAAAANTPCVAIFSARDQAGKWNPYGQGHTVLRRDVPCRHCQLTECIEQRMRCLTEIGVDEVIAAADAVLQRRSREAGPKP